MFLLMAILTNSLVLYYCLVKMGWLEITCEFVLQIVLCDALPECANF
jgi:hypothetical protein